MSAPNINSPGVYFMHTMSMVYRIGGMDTLGIVKSGKMRHRDWEDD